MKKTLFFFAFLLQTSLILAQENILFIGNSMTYYNGMPQLFRQLAESKGKDVYVDSFTIGGAGLAYLSAQTALHNKINSLDWDIVIIQPGTAESGGQVPVNQTIQYAQTIVNLVKAQNECARIFIYEVSNGIPAPNNQPNFNLYFQTQTAIKNTITTIATALNVPYIPAGEAFRAHYTDNQNLLLHPMYNDVHPNYYGSYLVAASVYTTLFAAPVYPSTFVGTDETLAHYLQTLADDTVFNSLSEWRIGSQTYVDFQVTVTNATVTLENNSIGYDAFSWHIDGVETTLDNDTHTFDSVGEKEIKLQLTKDGCTYSLTKKVQIVSLSTQSVEIEGFAIYPNPAKDFIIVEKWEEIHVVQIFDIAGKQMFNKVVESPLIDISLLEKGTYLLKFTTHNGGSFFRKLIVE